MDHQVIRIILNFISAIQPFQEEGFVQNILADKIN
jgi:hypothetical protein